MSTLAEQIKEFDDYLLYSNEPRHPKQKLKEKAAKHYQR
jgi:hypothetical protein